MYCIQQNLHKSKEVTLEINGWLDELRGKEGVGLLQEPNNYKGKVPYLRNKCNIYIGKHGVNNRAIIVTTKGLECWKLNQYCSEDQVTIALKMKDQSIIIMSSIYMPYDSTDPPPTVELMSLVSFCEERGLELIIGTDSNCHNAIWGSSNTNHRGEKLMEYIVTTNLQICNTGTQPTFENSIRSEIIDLTLATTQASSKIQDWKVITGKTASDHNMIAFKYQKMPKVLEEEYKNVRRTNWDLYREKLRKYLSELENTTDIDGKMNGINQAITRAYSESCPTSKRKTTAKPSWWNSNLSKLKREAIKYRNRYKREPTEYNINNWKEKSQDYKKELQKA